MSLCSREENFFIMKFIFCVYNFVRCIQPNMQIDRINFSMLRYDFAIAIWNIFVCLSTIYKLELHDFTWHIAHLNDDNMRWVQTMLNMSKGAQFLIFNLTNRPVHGASFLVVLFSKEGTLFLYRYDVDCLDEAGSCVRSVVFAHT